MSEKSKQSQAHTRSADQTLEAWSASKEGLSPQEVRKRQQEFGPNKLQEKKQKSLFRLAIDQLNNPIIYLLTGAVIVSLIFNDIPEAIAILIVILLNTAIGFWMEYQARKSVDALKKLDQLETHVRRDGKSQKINAEELVPGDILVLESGDLVPADARILQASELAADESPLTGESVPTEKFTDQLNEETPLAERTNMLFKGTAITSGKGEAMVTAIGHQTEIGKVSDMVDETKREEIPLNRKLAKLSHRLIWFILGLAVLFFIFGWWSGKEIYLLLQTSIAWTVAAIPEGLPIVASIALARGMLRLAKRNVIVKKLEAVETLGETTVIFTDKTGTLTKNELTVSLMEYPGKSIEVEQTEEAKYNLSDTEASENENFQHLFKISVFCNDAEWLNERELKGDALDAALLQFAKSFHPEHYEKLTNTERIHEDPFDSESKFVGTVHQEKDILYVAAKGAAEPILSRSAKYLDNGKEVQLNEQAKSDWLKKNRELSESGLRIIAYAYRQDDLSQKDQLKAREDFVEEMVFVGFIGFIDPARKEVQPAIEKCHQAGIKVVMVTGDHPGIARTIAHEVNLTDNGHEQVIEGKNLDEKESEIINSPLFARVDPGQKLDIVEHYKKKGEITAMTGDGINDTPALKMADIGIAMGDKGTQAAQDVADMVLKDDSFSSIVDAIEQGRVIFGNIRKFVLYQLSYHLAEILIIAGISFTLFHLPLLPLQLLFLNLLSDVFPALALGIGKGDATIMQQPPKNPDEPIINRNNWIAISVYGMIMALVMIGTYLVAFDLLNESKETANTITFFSLAVAQLLHVFNMRDPQEKIFNNQVVRNKYIWLALGICAIMLSIAYLTPLLHEVLSFEQLTLVHWGLVALSSFLVLLITQLVKKIFRL
ncbi:cation-translocating P-type ATPase [Sunxiuqinia dokdonensis]|uniref:Cation-transporting P-type ATPase N-terminal domain-containing protein n=1 Tax=Sunxiuqinia dokdonensis TaxID=1409788 RepID=A0A0L8V9V9_9BACT|nr:cation-transporting P-type ATPase [Sunxiuqinia dokdonensis]KOH45236.1 hypothetical protein NC99_19280 [Sunxiuqinia dokdonensis]